MRIGKVHRLNLNKKKRNESNRFLRNTGAQMTVVGLLMIFLLLTVLNALNDDITDYATNMSDNLTARGYTEEGLLARLIPLFIFAVVLATIALYGSPQP